MKLIDADKLIKKSLEMDGIPILKVENIKSICGIPIEEITVDAKPIKYGYWMFKGNDVWVCSVCGTRYVGFDGMYQTFAEMCEYCPHCGTKMNMKGEEK